MIRPPARQTEPTVDISGISPDPSKNKGLDYNFLREKGIALTQQLSSAIWTDYNEHDPGVTTLEQLCYALTELSYRAEFPLADLLAEPVTGDIHPRRHGMFIPRRILPCNPVTVNDYRKLFVDRVPAVRNAWLFPRIPASGSKEVNGLYDILLYAPESDECHRDCHYKPKRIVEKITQVYNRHRNICEDLHSVHLLKPLRATLSADVTLGPAADPSSTVAGIYFAAGNLMSPELPRESLKSLMAAGESSDQIFNGPLLLNGFIPDASLQCKRLELPVNDVLAAIAQSKGVVGVRNLAVRTGHTGDGGRYSVNESIPIPVERILHLETQPIALRLLRNGKIVHPDPQTVERELSQLWAAYRRPYPLELQYEEFFGAPTGTHRDLELYYSIQNQYPGVYGINSFGLPPNASPARRAQAKQLKAYLLPFEQLMADYFSQLAHIGDLYTLSATENPTYYWQSLEKSVPNVAPVLAQDYRSGLKAIVNSEGETIARRNRFTNFLLSLYANELYAQNHTSQTAYSPAAAERLLRARLAFLKVLVASTRSRGRAFDYQAQPSHRNFAGMEIKCRLELGLDLEHHQPWTDALETSRLTVVRDAADATIGRAEAQDSAWIDDHFRPLTSFPPPDNLPEISSILKGSAITEEFIDWASNPGNLYVGRFEGEETVTILCRTPQGGWIVVDVEASVDIAVIEANALWRYLRSARHARTQLYIVEHTLLRHGRRPHRRRHHRRDEFVYSFTLTAVVSLPAHERIDRDIRTTVEEVIRENTPADTVAQVCFLDPWSMTRFERLNRLWRSALHRGHRFSIALSSARLRRFLERHRHTTSTPQL